MLPYGLTKLHWGWERSKISVNLKGMNASQCIVPKGCEKPDCVSVLCVYLHPVRDAVLGNVDNGVEEIIEALSRMWLSSASVAVQFNYAHSSVPIINILIINS